MQTHECKDINSPICAHLFGLTGNCIGVVLVDWWIFLYTSKQLLHMISLLYFPCSKTLMSYFSFVHSLGAEGKESQRQVTEKGW